MAFPLDCVAPLCNSFLQRAEKLLVSGDSAINFPKIRYAILTLKLLVEKNEHALNHLTMDITQSRSGFLAAAFQYMLRGRVVHGYVARYKFSRLRVSLIFVLHKQ